MAFTSEFHGFRKIAPQRKDNTCQTRWMFDFTHLKVPQRRECFLCTAARRCTHCPKQRSKTLSGTFRYDRPQLYQELSTQQKVLDLTGGKRCCCWNFIRSNYCATFSAGGTTVAPTGHNRCTVGTDSLFDKRYFSSYDRRCCYY